MSSTSTEATPDGYGQNPSEKDEGISIPYARKFLTNAFIDLEPEVVEEYLTDEEVEGMATTIPILIRHGDNSPTRDTKLRRFEALMAGKTGPQAAREENTSPQQISNARSDVLKKLRSGISIDYLWYISEKLKEGHELEAILGAMSYQGLKRGRQPRQFGRKYGAEEEKEEMVVIDERRDKRPDQTYKVLVIEGYMGPKRQERPKIQLRNHPYSNNPYS